MAGAAPAVAQGVSWGIPWPQGTVTRQTPLTIKDAQNRLLPLQTWPMAYWPDGSVKWTGHAMVAPAGMAGPLTVAPGPAAQVTGGLTVATTSEAITIDTGTMTCRIPTSGAYLIDRISKANTVIARQGQLVALREDRSELETKRTLREETFISQIAKVTVEQSGPVRAVVKIEGKHKASNGERAWLPFTVRLYFFAGLDSIKMVHSFVFDGDQEQDFIRGLGIRLSVPLREQYHNRHVRFAGDTGLFAEPAQVILGRRNPGMDLYNRQIAGQRIANLDQLPGRQMVEQMAVWDSYKLTQIADNSYCIQKRTNPNSAWITATTGQRSAGLAFVGDVSGGLALGMKHFWQLAPTALEITKLSTENAELTLWLWSPDAPAMDLRHYDVKGHGLDASYEDYQEGFATATGVARTSELTLHVFDATPATADLQALADADAHSSLLVCTPAYYHALRAFGIWSLPDRSTPMKQWLETGLDNALSFYQGQVEQRHWYGFWDYGDFMHSYDATRHVWRYDIGGFAWDNTELMPNLWLWYSFLRTGRADIFTLAEALTRHTQEVDVYHLGRFAGFGSRHNVRHWGDGAKEVRISQALLKRPYYYLTTDERMADLMDEVLDVDQKLPQVDPLRMVEKEKIPYPTHLRAGPDWYALMANWFAAWERTGDTQYRDRIVTGMKSFAALPHTVFAESFGYDPRTRRVYQIHDKIDSPTLAALMGGPEANFEIVPVINVPEWTDVWLKYCQYTGAPAAEQQAALGGAYGSNRGPDFARLAGYAAFIKKDPALAKRAWEQFMPRAGGRIMYVPRPVDAPNTPAPIDEIPWVSTNSTAQWSLNAIELLEMIGEYLPANPQ